MAKYGFRRIHTAQGRIVLMLLVIGSLVGLTVWASSNSRAARAFTTQPEAYTELYVTNPADLPSKVEAGKTYTVAITIANHEGSTQHYTYRTTVTGATGHSQITNAATTIQDGRSTTHYIRFSIPEPGTAYTVQVQLVNRKQSIGFHLQS